METKELVNLLLKRFEIESEKVEVIKEILHKNLQSRHISITI